VCAHAANGGKAHGKQQQQQQQQQHELAAGVVKLPEEEGDQAASPKAKRLKGEPRTDAGQEAQPAEQQHATPSDGHPHLASPPKAAPQPPQAEQGQPAAGGSAAAVAAAAAPAHQERADAETDG
jgi:hypothetical protein